MLAPFGPAERTRLVAILGRLESNHDGEKVAAALAATRTLRKHGLTWAELIASPASERQGPYQHQARPAGAERPDVHGWQANLALCRRHLERLSSWEADFVLSLAVRRKSLSSLQTAKLAQIAAALRDRGLV